METITRVNGNKQIYTTDLPRLIMHGYCNDVALAHIEENTGLHFVKNHLDSYEAQPASSNQIVTLFLTYNFKTRYYNNWNHKNELHLKSDHHIGYDVDSICFDCCKQNHIHTNGMTSTDRLSC